MTLKEKTLNYYKQLVQDKIDAFQDMISNLTDDAQNDAKGSAGDKHETALSMMHLEQEKLNHKLKEFLEQKGVLDKIDASKETKIITLGSVVKANGILLFMSAALPKIKSIAICALPTRDRPLFYIKKACGHHPQAFLLMRAAIFTA